MTARAILCISFLSSYCLVSVGEDPISDIRTLLLTDRGLLEDPAIAKKQGVSFNEIIDYCNSRLENPESRNDLQELLLLRAQGHIGRRSHHKAINDASQAILYEKSIFAGYVLGRAAVGCEQYEVTKRAIEYIENIDKNAVELHCLRAILALACDFNREMALVSIDIAIKSDPTHTFAFALRATVRKSLGDYEGALRDINRYLSSHSEGPLGNPITVYLLQADVYKKLGQQNLADKTLRKVQELYRLEATDTENIAKLQTRRGISKKLRK